MAFIDVEKFKEAVIAMSSSICSNWETAGILNLINAQPTADVKEVVRGKWVQINNTQEHYCSECGVAFNLYQYCKADYNLCPSCGADLREVE